ncbi:MAG TPA: methylmalonyl-CoA mutase family protein, partial [Thermaerobacter sp.]
TAQQPENNIVRVTLQALMAVLGGTQSLHTNAMDEALALPTDETARIALRTQQIIAYESGVTNTVDPLAGSYFVESLTNRIEEEAQRYLDRIEEMGGAVAAIERGFMQREIMDAAYRYQREVESGRRVVVGVNKYVIEEEPPRNLLRVDPSVRERQIRRLEEVRRRRDAAEVEASLRALEQAARGTENLMPHILRCVRAYATLGEICDTLRRVFGEYRPPADF